MSKEELQRLGERDEIQSRRMLGQELEGLGGLVFRLISTLDPDAMHACALSVVCEAIYLARQVMAEDRLEKHDVDDLLNAVARLQQKAREWQVNLLHAEVWQALPDSFKPPEGPAQVAVDFALREWLTRNELEGKSASELAAEFVRFCETAPNKDKASRKHVTTES